MTTRLTVLPSGLAIATDRMAHLKTVSISIVAGVGSRDEGEGEHGLSHLLEHMAFKGTSRRTARQIAEEIEAVGGELNAATGAENTSYYARVLEADMPLAMDILSDILVDPQFDAGELAKEQNVIISEIGAAEDTPEDVVFDRFSARAFPDQPLGRSILGTPETVKAATPAGLSSYLRRHYRAPRMVVAAAGAVDHDALVAEAEARLPALTGEAAAPAAPARYVGGIETKAKSTEQTNILLGFRGVSYRVPEVYALGVFSSLLGGGLSSRLFQEVREERGLCYSIYAFHWAYGDTGLFGISAGTDPADAPELMRVTLDALRAAAEGASEAEVNRAKAQMKVGLLGALENSGARTDQLARQVLAFGQIIPVEEIARRVDAVTPAAVRAAAQAMLAGSPLTFAALGPKRGLDKAARLAEQFKP